MLIKKITEKTDPVILSLILMLVVFGLVMISSAGVIVSVTRFDDKYYFFKHQLFYGVLPGLFFMFVFSKIKYTFWKKISFLLFLLSLTFLILIFIPGFGVELLGASRWINLGPISFQPSELTKLAIVIYLASWLDSHNDKLFDFKEGLIPFALIMSIVTVLIIKQPDVGTLGAISVIALTMFFVAGAPIRYIFSLVFGGFLMLGVLIKLEPYRMNRFLAFVNPEIDPQGIGYQVRQSLIAFGSGGVLGVGIGESRQKYNYLPEPLGDSIYAIVGEELGLIGASFLLVLFIMFALRGLKIARNAPDKFSSLVATGIVAWILFQAMINIMAIIGLIPLTGITLPFISYGSTSMIFVMIGVGILLNISKYSKI